LTARREMVGVKNRTLRRMGGSLTCLLGSVRLCTIPSVAIRPLPSRTGWLV
jgi:hypothetical protein